MLSDHGGLHLPRDDQPHPGDREMTEEGGSTSGVSTVNSAGGEGRHLPQHSAATSSLLRLREENMQVEL